MSALAHPHTAARRPAFTRLPTLRPVAPSSSVCVNGTLGPGKNWESYETNKKGKPVRYKMHVKRGDLIVVIKGKREDRGVTGRILEVYPKTGKVLVDNVNIQTKTRRKSGPPERRGMANYDQIREPAPIDHSAVMHWSEKEQVRSRMGFKFVDGNKVRYLKKTGEELPARPDLLLKEDDKA